MDSFPSPVVGITLLLGLTILWIHFLWVPRVLFIFIILVGLFLFSDYLYSRHKIRSIIYKLMFLVIVAYTLFILISDNVAQTRDGELAHDNVYSMNEAVNFLKSGINPYRADYQNTSMKVMSILPVVTGDLFENPALKYFNRLPVHLYLATLVSLSVHDYDARYFYGILVLITMVLVFSLPYKLENQFIVNLLVLFNPIFLHFLSQGRKDVLLVFMLMLLLKVTLVKPRFIMTIFLGVMLATDQILWFLYPFVLAFLYGRKYYLTKKTLSMKSFGINYMLLPSLIALILVLPFVVWDIQALIAAVVLYPLGMTDTPLPINGYGLSTILYQAGYIEKITSPYPGSFVMLLSIPLLVLFMKKLVINPTVHGLVTYYGIFLGVIWFFSRYFNDNHIMYIAQFLIIGGYLAMDRNIWSKYLSSKRVLNS